MSEAVIVPSLMVMTSIVSEESLARDTHRQTDTHTDFHRLLKTKIAVIIPIYWVRTNKKSTNVSAQF